MKLRNYKTSTYFAIFIVFILALILFSVINPSTIEQEYQVENNFESYALEPIEAFQGNEIQIKLTNVEGQFRFLATTEQLLDNKINMTITSNTEITVEVIQSGDVGFEINTLNSHGEISFTYTLIIENIPTFQIITFIASLTVTMMVFSIEYYFDRRDNQFETGKINHHKSFLEPIRQKIWETKAYIDAQSASITVSLFLIPLLIIHFIYGNNLNIQSSFNSPSERGQIFSENVFIWNLTSQFNQFLFMFTALALPLLFFREFYNYKKTTFDHHRTYPNNSFLSISTKVGLAYVFCIGYPLLRFIQLYIGNAGLNFDLQSIYILIMSFVLVSLALIIVISIFLLIWDVFHQYVINLFLFPIFLISILEIGSENGKSPVSIVSMKYLGVSDFEPDIWMMVIYRLISLLIVLLLFEVHHFIKKRLQ